MEAGNFFFSRRVIGEVGDFVRIRLEIEELGDGFALDVVANHLPSFVADGFLGVFSVPVGVESGIADLGFFAGDDSGEALAVDGFWGGEIQNFAESGEEVGAIAEGVGLAHGNARAGDDEGDADGFFVDVLFAEEAMRTDGEAVIAGVEYDGIVELAGGF